MTKIERPRGTHDILPSEQPRWRHVTGEMERLAGLYGYRPIQTPVFEDTDLFLRTSGQGSDVVQKEMYTFADRSDRSLTLRPEGTAPIARAYVEHGLHREPQPQKLYTIGPMYRYGAPGRGRYREHWQLSVEAIGTDDPAIDAEIIQLYDTLLRRLGITTYRLELNSIGCRDCRPAYVERLTAWLEDHEDELDEEARQKLRTSPLRVFDVKNERTRALLQDAPKIGDSLCDACQAHFAAVRADLDATGVAYEIVPTLVRGLDYYSRTTWEFIGPMDNENSTISGGGRYDYLVEEIGGPPTPGVGFGAGIERLLIAMEDEGVAEPAAPARRCLRRRRARRTARARATAAEGTARRRHRRRHGLRRPLAQGPADAGRPLGRADDGDRPSGRRADPPRRRAGRTGRPRGRSRQTVPMTTWRTHMAGEPTKELVGEKLVLAGWVARRRDHGGLIFVDLRDRSGITQLVINPELAAEAAELAHQIRNEFVLRAEGTLVARSAETVNPNMPTGEVELQVEQLEIVSRSTPLPFQLDEENVDETLRLRYRWLDLRREKLQRNITLRAQMVGIIRREMEEAGFLDIQTPILFKPTPEGARDFVVPARLQKGRFYALPQSPQILKQLTMVAGFDRYYQIAICFRDEDLRADRVQEITQLDVEMSFPDQEFLYATMERMYARIWRECLGIEIPTPFPRMTFEEADRRFGTDKPDTRFGLEIEDATEATRNSEFGVFKSADAVRFLRVPQAYSRGDLAKLEELAKEWGAKGLAYLVFDEEGEVRSPIAKFLSEEELALFRSDPGSTVLFAADSRPATSRVLGALRSHLGKELGLIDEEAFTFLWVYDFPMFERDEEEGPLDGRAPSLHPAER